MTVKKPIQHIHIDEETGNKYVFQKPTNLIALEIIDATEMLGDKLVLKESFPLLFKHVVIQPQDLTTESFDTVQELIRVGSAAIRFLTDGDAVSDSTDGEDTDALRK